MWPKQGLVIPILLSPCKFLLLAEQHEQDMLEELDKMHEECQALREDSQVRVTVCLITFLPGRAGLHTDSTAHVVHHVAQIPYLDS